MNKILIILLIIIGSACDDNHRPEPSFHYFYTSKGQNYLIKLRNDNVEIFGTTCYFQDGEEVCHEIKEPLYSFIQGHHTYHYYHY